MTDLLNKSRNRFNIKVSNIPLAPIVPISPWIQEDNKQNNNIQNNDLNEINKMNEMYKIGTLISNANATFGKSLSKEDREKYLSNCTPAPQVPVSPWLPYMLESDVVRRNDF